MKEPQKILEELIGSRPEELNGEAKRLFEAIMKIADERDEFEYKYNRAIEDLVKLEKERQADKEKIKELEAINKRLRYTMNNAYLLDYIPRKVIEDKIEEENKQFDYFNNKNDEYGMLVYYVRKKVLQDLLKDGGE